MNSQQSVEKEEREVVTMPRSYAINYYHLHNKGKYCTFTYRSRKDGTVKEINGRSGVKKFLKDGKMGYDPAEKGLFPLYKIAKRLRDDKGHFLSAPDPTVTEHYATLGVEGLIKIKMTHITINVVDDEGYINKIKEK